MCKESQKRTILLLEIHIDHNRLTNKIIFTRHCILNSMNILSNKITLSPEEANTITTFKNKYFPILSIIPNLHTFWRVRHDKMKPDDIANLKSALNSIIKNNFYTNFDNIDYIEFHNINRQPNHTRNISNRIDTFNGQEIGEQILKSIVPENMAFCKVIFYFISSPTNRLIGHNLTIPDWDEYELGRTLSVTPQTGTNICCHVINESDTFAYTQLTGIGEIDSIIVNCVVERKAMKGRKRKNSCDANSLTNTMKNLRLAENGDGGCEEDISNPLSF
jgi:hypothetical protein